MRKFIALLFVSLMSGPASAAEPAPVAPPSAVLTASAVREVNRLVRSTPPEPRKAQPVQPQPKQHGWIARHPKLFGALVGFGVGCVAGASRVGGSEDTVFNALDEFACPAVGGIAAGAGALVGALVK